MIRPKVGRIQGWLATISNSQIRKRSDESHPHLVPRRHLATSTFFAIAPPYAAPFVPPFRHHLQLGCLDRPAGSTILILSKFEMEDLLGAIRTYKATYLPLVDRF